MTRRRPRRRRRGVRGARAPLPGRRRADRLTRLPGGRCRRCRPGCLPQGLRRPAPVPDGAPLRPWLLRIVANEARNRRRSAGAARRPRASGRGRHGRAGRARHRRRPRSSPPSARRAAGGARPAARRGPRGRSARASSSTCPRRRRPRRWASRGHGQVADLARARPAARRAGRRRRSDRPMAEPAAADLPRPTPTSRPRCAAWRDAIDWPTRAAASGAGPDLAAVVRVRGSRPAARPAPRRVAAGSWRPARRARSSLALIALLALAA